MQTVRPRGETGAAVGEEVGLGAEEYGLNMSPESQKVIGNPLIAADFLKWRTKNRIPAEAESTPEMAQYFMTGQRPAGTEIPPPPPNATYAKSGYTEAGTPYSIYREGGAPSPYGLGTGRAQPVRGLMQGGAFGQRQIANNRSQITEGQGGGWNVQSETNPITGEMTRNVEVAMPSPAKLMQGAHDVRYQRNPETGEITETRKVLHAPTPKELMKSGDISLEEYTLRGGQGSRQRVQEAQRRQERGESEWERAQARESGERIAQSETEGKIAAMTLPQQTKLTIAAGNIAQKQRAEAEKTWRAMAQLNAKDQQAVKDFEMKKQEILFTSQTEEEAAERLRIANAERNRQYLIDSPAVQKYVRFDPSTGGLVNINTGTPTDILTLMWAANNPAIKLPEKTRIPPPKKEVSGETAPETAKLIEGKRRQNNQTGQIQVVRGGIWVDEKTGQPIQ